MQIKSLVRTIPHHPKPGVMFRDITTLLKDATGFHATIETLAARDRDRRIAKVAGIEALGHRLFALCEFAGE
jgi:adenine phosphoribosyltransferase